MELFDEIYSSYYQVVAQILTAANAAPITREDMTEYSYRYGYEETAFAILPKLLSHTWPLLSSTDGKHYSSVLAQPPKVPFTILQKRWMKSLLQDTRIRLFFSDPELLALNSLLQEIPPLYEPCDFSYFDRFEDGDSYDDPNYRTIFSHLLTGLSEKKILNITYHGKKGAATKTHCIAPSYLQYSAKNDKFRLYGFVHATEIHPVSVVLNVGRMDACTVTELDIPKEISSRSPHRRTSFVTICISQERNSLERSMLTFASYEKHTEYLPESKSYQCTIYYDMLDETELLVQILSFGPTIRVTGPDSFIKKIRHRVCRQHQLMES